MGRHEEQALDRLDEIRDLMRNLEQDLIAMRDDSRPHADELMQLFLPTKFNLELMFETLDEE